MPIFARRAGVSCVLGLALACGPAQEKSSASDDASASDPLTSTTGDASTTSDVSTTSDAAPSCLPIDHAGLALANEAGACGPPEGSAATISLRGPEAIFADAWSECPFRYEMDALCSVDAIHLGEAVTSLELACPEHGDDPWILEIDAPALHFPACEGDPLQVRYLYDFYGCGWGATAEALTIREPATARLLAAAYSGGPLPWFSPLELDVVDGGCPHVGDDACYSVRLALDVAEGGLPPRRVHDRTVRMVELSSRYVVSAAAESITEAECCYDCNLPAIAAVVLADP